MHLLFISVTKLKEAITFVMLEIWNKILQYGIALMILMSLRNK